MFLKIIESLRQILSENAYINIVVNNTIEKNAFSEYEKKLYTKIVYGVIENKLSIDYQLQPFIKGKRVKPFVKNALRVGSYGIDYLHLQDHYLVNSLVETVKKKDYKASTFVNAILRTYQQTPRRALPTTDKIKRLSIQYSINEDLVKLLLKQYPTEVEQILEVKKHETNTYFINTMKTSIEDLKKCLDKEKIAYKITKDMILEVNGSLIGTALFKEKKVIPQDKSSIEVGLVLNPKEHASVLDCCSAPGSKTMQLAIMMKNTGEIVAGDIYEHKIKLIESSKKQLGLDNVKPILADATTYDYQQKFDYILIDAPCSGLGVIHHKPDLKYQMNEEKIASIKEIQQKIVEHVTPFIKPKGIIVYSTCTINQDENELFMRKFLKDHPQFLMLEEIKHLPSDEQDGFYICKIQENSNA